MAEIHSATSGELVRELVAAVHDEIDKWQEASDRLINDFIRTVEELTLVREPGRPTVADDMNVPTQPAQSSDLRAGHSALHNYTKNGVVAPLDACPQGAAVSDIVTRLRGTYCSCDIPFHEHTCPMRQAADEIERLRNQLDAARTGKALLALEAERNLCDQLAEALRDLPWAQQPIAAALAAYDAARKEPL